MSHEYVPEFNCMIRGILEKLGPEGISYVDVICGSRKESLVYVDDTTVSTLVPDGEGGSNFFNWCYYYKASSFPVQLRGIQMTSKGVRIEVDLINNTYLEAELDLYPIEEKP